MALPALFLFLRWPQEGAVKTRLAADTSPQVSARLYSCFVEWLSGELRPWAGVSYELWYFVEPASACDSVRDWLDVPPSPGIARILAQPATDLAGRLEHAAEAASLAGCDGVLMLGTDCIDLDRDEVARAAESLSMFPAIIGPALDGGFWLAGLADWELGVFRDIPYSTEAAADILRDRLIDFGMPPLILGTRTDVDTLANWHAQRPEVRERIRAIYEKRYGAFPPLLQ